MRNQPPLSTAASAGYAQSEAATSILVSTVLSIVTFSFAIYLIDGGLAAACLRARAGAGRKSLRRQRR
ncbi:hypothetical protein [Pseudomonas frederiksbergensis]|uniref:hypothetical protein n=1 Tax=Pseudomonas TaxID=286 RepID=UPI0011148755|nr:hypothetical protein [Pseudomonas frederiksbergensis]